MSYSYHYFEAFFCEQVSTRANVHASKCPSEQVSTRATIREQLSDEQLSGSRVFHAKLLISILIFNFGQLLTSI